MDLRLGAYVSQLHGSAPEDRRGFCPVAIYTLGVISQHTLWWRCTTNFHMPVSCRLLESPSRQILEHVRVSTFGRQSAEVRQCPIMSVDLLDESGQPFTLEARAVPEIPSFVQRRPAELCDGHLHKLRLAHPVHHSEHFTVSLLIGADLYWSFVGNDYIRIPGGPTAVASRLGYLLSGPTGATSIFFSPSTHRTSTKLRTRLRLNVRTWLSKAYRQTLATTTSFGPKTVTSTVLFPRLGHSVRTDRQLVHYPIHNDISQRIDCCNRSTSLANSPAGPKSPLSHVRLSIILIANKVTNTTGNENSGPFIQPLVWVQAGYMYVQLRMHVPTSAGG